MSNWKVVLLTGAPAVGKTTLAISLEEMIEPLHRVDYGRLLLEYKQRTMPDLTYDEMRRKSAQLILPEDVRAMDSFLIERLPEWRAQTNVIIDSHAVTKETYGFRITHFSESDLARIGLDAIIVVYCHANEILRRIEGNPGGRSRISADEASHHMNLIESLATVYGVVAGCPVFLLDGTGSPSETAARCLEILSGITLEYDVREVD